MLILTRKIDEAVMINKNVKIVVRRVFHGQIKLEIILPEKTSCWDGEVNDQFLVGEVLIRVQSICGSYVSLGFQASREILIFREEIGMFIII